MLNAREAYSTSSSSRSLNVTSRAPTLWSRASTRAARSALSCASSLANASRVLWESRPDSTHSVPACRISSVKRCDRTKSVAPWSARARSLTAFFMRRSANEYNSSASGRGDTSKVERIAFHDASTSARRLFFGGSRTSSDIRVTSAIMFPTSIPLSRSSDLAISAAISSARSRRARISARAFTRRACRVSRRAARTLQRIVIAVTAAVTRTVMRSSHTGISKLRSAHTSGATSRQVFVSSTIRTLAMNGAPA